MPSRQDERVLPWIKRPDLLIDRYDAGSWVVKDPLTLTYTYLDDLECRILQLLDGRITFSGLLNRARQVSLDASVTAEELAEFIRITGWPQIDPSNVTIAGQLEWWSEEWCCMAVCFRESVSASSNANPIAESDCPTECSDAGCAKTCAAADNSFRDDVWY